MMTPKTANRAAAISPIARPESLRASAAPKTTPSELAATRPTVLPSQVGMIGFCNASAPVAGEVARHRARMAEQLAGAERLQGTYAFDLERSVKTYRLNKFLHDMVQPAHREAVRRAAEAAYAAAGLDDTEKDLLRRRDWRGLIHHGCIFFGLEKFGAVLGVSNLHIYAAMRGQSLEDFQKTRNTQVLYSVAGQDSPELNWHGQTTA